MIEQNTTNKKVVIISSISSDIGFEMAKRYAKEGWIVIGTYRSNKLLDKLLEISPHIFYCDLTNTESINNFIEEYKKLNLNWDEFISCAGTQNPIGNFFNCDFNKWNDSIHVNAIEQLRIFHILYPHRNKDKNSNAIFFAGGGTNNAVLNYSAYVISKIMLIKMCELIDFETKDINTFIVGPGWTKTKMHFETINEKRENVGSNYEKTVEFMKNEKGTSMDDIYDCIQWLCKQGKEISGGRNFSVVHDKWKGEKKEKLRNELKSDFNMYKLRRCKNEWKTE